MRKNVMKLTAGVLSTAVLAGILPLVSRQRLQQQRNTGMMLPGSLQTGATGKRTGLLIAVSMNMYH